MDTSQKDGNVLLFEDHNCKISDKLMISYLSYVLTSERRQ